MVSFIAIFYVNFHPVEHVDIGRDPNKEHKRYSPKPFALLLFLQWFTGLLKDLENDDEHGDVFGYLLDKRELSSYNRMHSQAILERLNYANP